MANGNRPLFRLTALGASISLFALTLTPLAHAQAPAPAKAPAAAPAAGAKAEAKPADAAKPPDKKTRDAARKAYSAGEKAYGDGKYADAAENFQKANVLIPAPQALYWHAKSLDKQDKTEEAIAAYEKLLADPDAAKVGDDKVTDAKTRIEELKLKLVNVVSVVTVPAGAVVSVDGAPEAGTTPLTLKLNPGLRKLTISATGFDTKEVEVDAKAGQSTEQRIELSAKAPPPVAAVAAVAAVEQTPPPPPPPVVEKRSMVPAYVTLGVAAAGAVVGSIFGLKALASKSDFDDNPTTESADDAERNALIADMAFGVAITLGVTGIVLLTSDDEAPKESATVRLRRPSPVTNVALLPKKPPSYQLELDTVASPTSGSATARLRF